MGASFDYTVTVFVTDDDTGASDPAGTFITVKRRPAVLELVKSLSAENEAVRYSAIYALGSLREQGRPAYNELLNNLSSEDEFLQIASVWAMARIDPGQPNVAESGVPILVKALQSDRKMLRIEAAGTLGELGEAAKAGLPALKQALNDKSPRVQEAAKRAIARIEEGSPSPTRDVRNP